MHPSKSSTPRVSIPCGPDFPDNTRRRNALLQAREIAKKRRKAFAVLSRRCIQQQRASQDAVMTPDCAIIWDQLDEVQSCIDHIEHQLGMFRECWDDVECKIYDV